MTLNSSLVFHFSDFSDACTAGEYFVGKCYKPYESQTSFAGAKTQCSDDGGSLVEIHSEQENQHIRGLISMYRFHYSETTYNE